MNVNSVSGIHFKIFKGKAGHFAKYSYVIIFFKFDENNNPFVYNIETIFGDRWRPLRAHARALGISVAHDRKALGGVPNTYLPAAARHLIPEIEAAIPGLKIER